MKNNLKITENIEAEDITGIIGQILDEGEIDETTRQRLQYLYDAACKELNESKEVKIESFESGVKTFELKLDIHKIVDDDDEGPLSNEAITAINSDEFASKFGKLLGKELSATNLEYTDEGTINLFNNQVTGKYCFGYEGVISLGESKEVKTESPKVDNLNTKYKDVIDKLYKEGYLLDMENADEELKDEIVKCNYEQDFIIKETSSENYDVNAIVSFPFVYGMPDTRVSINYIVFKGNKVTAVEFLDELDNELEWFNLTDIEGLADYMFNKGII